MTKKKVSLKPPAQPKVKASVQRAAKVKAAAAAVKVFAVHGACHTGGYHEVTQVGSTCCKCGRDTTGMEPLHKQA